MFVELCIIASSVCVESILSVGSIVLRVMVAAGDVATILLFIVNVSLEYPFVVAAKFSIGSVLV